MNPLNFTNAIVSVAQPIQGLMNVTTKQNKLHDMQVDDTELRLLLADLYQHLGVQPRPNARQDAQGILMYVNQEQAYGLAQQKFMERQYAYMNGSVLERFRRFIGGQPLPPMNPSMPVGYQQPMPMYPPQGINMFQPGMPMMGMAPMPAPQAPPQAQPQAQAQPNQEFDNLRDQVSKLTGMMEHIVKNIPGAQN